MSELGRQNDRSEEAVVGVREIVRCLIVGITLVAQKRDGDGEIDR